MTFTVLAIGIPDDARAQSRAGAAMVPNGGSAPDTSKLDPCARVCANQAMACASAAGRARGNQADAKRCAAIALACMNACAPPRNDSQSAPATTEPDDPSPSTPDEAPEVPDPEAAFEKLLQSWQQSDNKRLVNADRRALQLTSDILRILCNQLNMKECATGAREVALPERPGSHRPSSDRWARRKNDPHSAAPTSAHASPKPAPKKAKGCYLKGQFTVVGAWGSDALYINTSLIASFTTSSSSDLEVKNLGNQPAWVGLDLVLNIEVPPHSTKHLSVPVYRAKDDYRASRATLSVKYWTETDEKKCAAGGEQPGFTTPEEWPQGRIDERLHTIE